MPEQNKSSIDAAAASLQQAISSGAVGTDVMKILSEVEGQLSQLRAAQKAQEDAITSLGERSKSLRDAETQFEQNRQELSKQQRQWDSERAELAERLQKAERNVGDLITQLEETNEQLAAKTKQLKEASGESQSNDKAAREASKRVEQLERDVDVLADKLKSAEKTASERAAELAASQQKLDEGTKKLAEFAKVLSEQTPELEKGAAAIAMVQQQQDQIERLTKQVAEQTLKSNPEEMQRRDKRIEELTDALRQARGQSAGQEGVAEVEQRNAELTAEVNRLKLELHNAQLGAEQLQKQLQERVNSATSQVVQDASSAQQAAKIAALTAQLEQFQTKAAAELKTQLEAQAKRHKQELSQSQDSDSSQVKQLRQKVEELEKELRAAKTAVKEAAGASVGASSDPTAQSSKLREQAERITAVAEHLRLRRARLAKVRQLMRKKASQSAGGTPSERMQVESLIQIEEEKAKLYALRNVLADSERRMIRRWAAPKAIMTVASIVVLLVVCAAATWLLVNHVYPARISAIVALESRNSSHTDPTPEQNESWRQSHLEMLHDAEFHKAVAERMAEHQIQQYANTGQVAARIHDDLTVDSTQSGRMVLTLAGNDDDEVATFLDLLTATIVAESNRQMSKRGDGVWAVASTERREEGQTRYCNPNPVPIRDDRLSRAMPIFGGMFAVLLTLILLAAMQYRKFKRVFDDENAALFTDAKVVSAA